jgi:small-conductance mechanosensitive channel
LHFFGTVVAVTRQAEQPDTSHDGPRPADPGRPLEPGKAARNHPFQAIISLILACGSAVAVNLYGKPLGIKTSGTGHLITLGGSIAFVVFGLISTFAWARWARAVLTHLVGPAYGSIVRFILIIFGMCVIVAITLSMLGFHVAQLVVGGAVTGVLITIAAQQALSNLFAGMLLQVAQPFKVGDSIWVRSGGFAGTIEGVVTEVSITYVTLENDEGRVMLPNAQVLAAAVSPIRSAPRAGVLTAHMSGRYGRFGRSSPRPPMVRDSESGDPATPQPDGG